MVYCTKCGYKNQDDATNCVSCGSSLSVRRLERHHHRREDDDMCFGRRGGPFWGIVFGVIVLLFGVTILLQQQGINIDFWPVFLIFIGILIIVGTLYRRGT